jgi:hypothetical protein
MSWRFRIAKFFHCRVKVVANDPDPRTVTNLLVVFEFVLGIVASVMIQFNEASGNLWFTASQEDCVFFTFETT